MNDGSVESEYDSKPPFQYKINFSEKDAEAEIIRLEEQMLIEEEDTVTTELETDSENDTFDENDEIPRFQDTGLAPTLIVEKHGAGVCLSKGKN